MAVLKIECFKYQEQSKLVKVLSNSIKYLEPVIWDPIFSELE